MSLQRTVARPDPAQSHRPPNQTTPRQPRQALVQRAAKEESAKLPTQISSAIAIPAPRPPDRLHPPDPTAVIRTLIENPKDRHSSARGPLPGSGSTDPRSRPITSPLSQPKRSASPVSIPEHLQASFAGDRQPQAHDLRKAQESTATKRGVSCQRDHGPLAAHTAPESHQSPARSETKGDTPRHRTLWPGASWAGKSITRLSTTPNRRQGSSRTRQDTSATTSRGSPQLPGEHSTTSIPARPSLPGHKRPWAGYGRPLWSSRSSTA